MVLVGDAAHRVHPLAGQGVNLGLLDAATLAQVVLDAMTSKKDIGMRAVLRRYERWRKGNNLAMLAVTFGTYVATGIATREMIPLFAVVAPAMLIPSLLGARLYSRISDTGFRKLVLGLLTASGVALLAASVPLLVRR